MKTKAKILTLLAVLTLALTACAENSSVSELAPAKLLRITTISPTWSYDFSMQLPIENELGDSEVALDESSGELVFTVSGDGKLAARASREGVVLVRDGERVEATLDSELARSEKEQSIYDVCKVPAYRYASVYRELELDTLVVELRCEGDEILAAAEVEILRRSSWRYPVFRVNSDYEELSELDFRTLGLEEHEPSLVARLIAYREGSALG